MTGIAAITGDAWVALWQALGAAEVPRGLFNQLVAAYSERQRRYHTLQHLRECLANFEAAESLAQHPAEVALALWFHDAVYDPTRADNEERSADWARRSIVAAGCAEAVAARVEAMVLATRHGSVEPDPQDIDTALLLDIDLAILGAAPARFDEYEQQVRGEYAHVPDAVFRERRAALLRGFLQQPRLYRTEAFAGALEARARENLARSIGRLAS